MKKHSLQNIILLSIGLFFFYFSNGKYNFPLAAWLYPIFILFISRRENKLYARLIIPMFLGIIMEISFWNTFDNPSTFLFYIPFFIGLSMGLIFLIDRILYSRLKGFVSTLAFPLAYTVFDFASNLLNPFGTTGVLGYSQFDFLSFSQLASITGMWGLTFMVTWFSSCITWFIYNYEDRTKTIRGFAIYFSILLTILIYGNIRLTLPLSTGTIQISGIHTHNRLEGNQILESLNNKDTLGFNTKNEEILKSLIKRTKIEAASGSQVIIWAENSFYVLKKNEDEIINLLRETALKNKIYIWVTPFVINKDSKSENKTLLFSPLGKLLSTHFKYGGNFLEGTVEGDKTLKPITTELGNFTGIVCWDGDFPSIVKQVGKENTDVLFIPASDWNEINPLHSTIAAFRGIENGCSVVRQTRNGLSFMNDPRGKTITRMDHFLANSWNMTGHVPNKRIWSLYPIIGDLFGWLSLGGFSFLTVIVLLKKRNY